MPRPVFGEADWWTFEELDDPKRFTPIGRFADGSDVFATWQAKDADDLATETLRPDEDVGEVCGASASGRVTWPGFEFCVSRVNKVVLMVRRPEACPARLT